MGKVNKVKDKCTSSVGLRDNKKIDKQQIEYTISVFSYENYHIPI